VEAVEERRGEERREEREELVGLRKGIAKRRGEG
jgi:hypothetical protein